MNEEEIIYFYNVKDGKYYQSRYTHRWLNNLQQQCKKQKEVIDKAIDFYETYKQECVIGRTRDEKLIKDYYLPAQLSKDLIEILKEEKND